MVNLGKYHTFENLEVLAGHHDIVAVVASRDFPAVRTVAKSLRPFS
jgi:hypothetical protein